MKTRTLVVVLSLLALPIPAFALPPVVWKHLARRSSAARIEPKVDRILEKWGAASMRLKDAKARVAKYSYDTVFQVERRGKGTIRFETLHQFRLELQPVKIKDGEKSRKLSPRSKRPFALKSVVAEQVVSDGKTITIKSANKKPFTIAHIDLANPRVLTNTLGKRSLTCTYVPGLLGISTHHLKTVFRWKISHNSDSEVRLNGKPRVGHFRIDFRECQVILDKKTWLPKAFLTIDPPGSREFVYVFYDWKTAPWKMPR